MLLPFLLPSCHYVLRGTTLTVYSVTQLQSSEECLLTSGYPSSTYQYPTFTYSTAPGLRLITRTHSSSTYQQPTLSTYQHTAAVRESVLQ